jgi:nucleoside-diphosphate-sugar epimerase
LTVAVPGPVAVTGATGFIGRCLTDALVSSGIQVHALIRNTRSSPAGARLVVGDLHDRDALDRLLQRTAAVVHCAGAVRGCSSADFQHANVDGTARLLEAVARSDSRPRLLLMSSLAARSPHLSWYAGSKRRAEEVLERARYPEERIVFRPPAVYGPGDREIRPLLRAMHAGIAPVPGASAAIGARFSLLHVFDLVDAVKQWLFSNHRCEGTFELHDGTPGGYDWNTLVAIAVRAWNRRIRLLPIPAPILYAVAWPNLWCGRLMRRPAMLTPGKVRELTHPDWVCDNTALTAATGWEPRIRFADALSGPGLITL